MNRPERIRHIKRNEWNTFMRLLERSYGHPRGFFTTHYPHIFHPDDSYRECFYVVEQKGKIVSHVGLFPLKVMAEDIRITLGGIGGVATLPEERGRGYMQKLLLYIIAQMQEKDISVSVLWGDRQRYGNFGWEIAGEKIILHFNERSLTKSGVEGISPIREVGPQEVISRVRPLYIKQKFRVDRGRKLKGILCRAGNRIWIGDDGYLCGRCIGDKLVVSEVVSLSGKEASLIMAVMQWCFVKQAEVAVCSQDSEYLDRLMRPACGCHLVPEGMFRINNCYKFINSFIPILEKRATELKIRDFSLSIGLRFNDKVDVVTVSYKSGIMCISQKKVTPYIELDEREGVRLFIGGPFPDKKRLGIFSVLLPLPIHVPELDTV